MATTTAAVFEHVLREFPDVHAALTDAQRAAFDATDPELLDLCRLLVAHMLRCEAEQATTHQLDPAKVDAVTRYHGATVFTERENAALRFTEQFVFDVASLTDETAADLRNHLGDSGLLDFTQALLVVEQRIRLRLMWQRLQRPEVLHG